MAFRILAFDGGGIRGVLSIHILERLETIIPDLMSKFDMIAGTSTGGILALALAAGFSTKQVRELYQMLGEKVFVKSFFEKVVNFDELYQADYSNVELFSILTGIFGDMRLKDLKKKVVISSFALDNRIVTTNRPRAWKAKFFQNFSEEDSDANELVVDVALRTCAAPTYFPIYQGFVDGGVVANNPSMCALAQAIDTGTGGKRLSQVVLLSIGTGVNGHYMTEVDSNWGLLQWAPHLITMMMDGSVGLADYQCARLLGNRYLRINPVIHKDIKLDDIAAVPFLLDIVDIEDLTQAQIWLKRYFRSSKKVNSVQNSPESRL